MRAVQDEWTLTLSPAPLSGCRDQKGRKGALLEMLCLSQQELGWKKQGVVLWEVPGHLLPSLWSNAGKCQRAASRAPGSTWQMWFFPDHPCDHLAYQPPASPVQHRSSEITHKFTHGMPSSEPSLRPVWGKEPWHLSTMQLPTMQLSPTLCQSRG